MTGMEPQIRYARTSDGVNIAWYSVGDGFPWLWPSVPPSHVAQQWRMPDLRRVLEMWPDRGARLVGCDFRGCGLSDRGPMDHSLDAMVRDLEAVADAASLDRPFILQAFSYASIPALAFAARHPDRVRALVLQNGLASGADLGSSWVRLARLAAEDWDEAKWLMGRIQDAGWALSLNTLDQSRRLFDEACTQQEFLALSEAVSGWDVSAELSQISAPVLILYYNESMHTPLEASKRLAASLPSSSFALVERTPDGVIIDAVLPVYDGFLDSVFRRVPRASSPDTTQAARSSSGMAVILFTDIVDSTPLTERMGDAAFRTASRALDDRLRGAIRAHGGTPVEGKLLGDGVMGVFASAADAIATARDCVAAADELPLHIGLHAGDVIREEDNVYGGAVNIASRICALCEPGEVLVSQTVRDLARTSAGVSFEDRGEHALKGIEDPVRVFAVNPDRA
jgi:class 3 adenylate cyclase